MSRYLLLVYMWVCACVRVHAMYVLHTFLHSIVVSVLLRPTNGVTITPKEQSTAQHTHTQQRGLVLQRGVTRQGRSEGDINWSYFDVRTLSDIWSKSSEWAFKVCYKVAWAWQWVTERAHTSGVTFFFKVDWIPISTCTHTLAHTVTFVYIRNYTSTCMHPH